MKPRGQAQAGVAGMMMPLSGALWGCWPTGILALFGALTIFLVPGLARLELRTDGAAVYPRGEPVVALTIRTQRPSASPGGRPPAQLPSRRSAIASPAGSRRIAAAHQAVGLLPAAHLAGVRSLASLLDPPASWISLADVPRYLDEIPERTRGVSGLLARVRRTACADLRPLPGGGRRLGGGLGSTEEGARPRGAGGAARGAGSAPSGESLEDPG